MIIGALIPTFTAGSTPPRTLSAGGPSDSFGKTSDGRATALEVLTSAGRPDAKADVKWLEKRFGNAPDLGDLAKFYVVAQGRYSSRNPKRDYLIEESLKSLRPYLDEGNVVTTWQGGQITEVKETHHLNRDERVDCVLALLRNIPPEKSSYVLPTSDAINVIGRLREILDQQDDGLTSLYHVGGPPYNERLCQMKPISGPKPTMREAVHAFTGYLDSITHAEGRKSAKLDWSDDHSAWSAVRLSYNLLDRDPDRTASFGRMVSVLQNPWHAAAVATDLDWVPAAKRVQVETELMDQVRQHRATAGAPQNHLDTTDEGTFLNGLSRTTCWSYALERPGQPRDQALAEATVTLDTIQRTVTTSLQDKAFALCLLGRGSNEPVNQVAADLSKLTRELWKHGHSTESAFRIFELLARTPEFGDNRTALIDVFMRQREALPKETDAVLVEESLARVSPQELGAELRSLSEKIFLTGDIGGMERLRARVEADVKAGVLSGDIDELMHNLEIQVRLQRVAGNSAEDAVEKAYASLRTARSRQLSVEVQEDRVVIGGIVLPRRQS